MTDTFVDSIALSSPSGRMSKRARKAAEQRIYSQWSEDAQRAICMLPPVRQSETPEQRRETLLRSAANLRELAGRGMCVRKYIKEAERLEVLANGGKR